MLNRCTYILLVLSLLGGCGEGESFEDASPPSDVGSVDAGEDSEDADTSVGCVPPSGVQDGDQDGLLDAIEDRNLNCRVDEGETDPRLADTDGDGLLDGDEDVDRDGVWDEQAGELDPRRADTDGDGESDGEEVLATVCTSSIFAGGTSAAIGDRMQRVFLPSGWEGGGETARGGGLATTDGGAAFWGHDSSIDVVDVDRFLLRAAASLAGSGWDFGMVWSDADGELSGELRLQPAAEGGGRQPDPWSPAAVFVSVVQAVWDVAVEESLLADLGELERGWVLRYTVQPSTSSQGFVLTMLDMDSEVGPPALGPTQQARLRAHCETQQVVRAANELHVFAAVDTYGSRTTADVVLAALVALESERSARGLSTHLWLTRGDAHLSGAPGVPAVADETDPAAWRRATQSFFGGHEDQRVWLNLLSLERHARIPADAQRIFVTGLVREDSEFRSGALNGRDGDPSEPPLPAGALRSALDDFYSQRLTGPVYAFAPVIERPAGELCSGTYGPEDRVEPAVSALEIAHRTGGALVERCAPMPAEAVMETLEAGGWVWPTASLTYVPIPATILIADAAAGLAERVEQANNVVRASVSEGTIEIAGAYLYWEDAR